ncbi:MULTISPECIES: hypothetical protein [Lysobacteraceae]|jgi:hypothetical protein|uniref:Uncharacterized protein n=1 Tax=Lysobacter silvisoli TaxID=2293254 RepID=A0A371K3P8_9GAMM|nr:MULTISPECIES: hypothetical protein [Xanthomonadaceae]KAF1723467.1 hypothetical protein CSC76_15255 [Pseudoxanthomonas mexicana]RDZ28549.1 hypothetical protein DX914_05315 [Lysobacter silvisoli]
MHEVDIETVRMAMFVHSGVKAVDSLRLYRSVAGTGLAATLTVAAPDVDQTNVRDTIATVLRERFGIDEVDLQFQDPGPIPHTIDISRGLIEKK